MSTSGATSTSAAGRLMVTNHEKSYIEVRETLQMYGTCRDSYIIEGSTTSYDASS